MVFEESGLLFNFSDAWNVRPFDHHRYYRWLSGLGFRGVDFVGIYQEKLVLMEIKNYQRREGMPKTDAFQIVREDPEAFALKMAAKVEDSFEIILAVNGVFRRRWWFPFFVRLPLRFKRRYPQSYFWYAVSQLAEDPADCIFVLWLDADSETGGVENEIKETLAINLAGLTSEVIVTGRKTYPFRTDLSFSSVWKD